MSRLSERERRRAARRARIEAVRAQALPGVRPRHPIDHARDTRLMLREVRRISWVSAVCFGLLGLLTLVDRLG